jgi:hypothetical protein
MTGRDRIVVIAIALLLVLGAGWLLVVSPERKQAATLDAQVSTARAQLASAKTQVANASGAQAKYESAYTSIVSLGKAVPASQEVPSLMYQIAQATHQKHVEFQSITSGSGSSGSGSTPTAAAAAGGFTQMPFTFVFNGNFFALYNLFQQLDGFTVRSASGGLTVSGRLLTIQSVKLVPSASSSSGRSSGKGGSEELSGTITATAYVLPASQGLTAGATTGAPASASSAAATASTSAAPSSPTAPAVARVTP